MLLWLNYVVVFLFFFVSVLFLEQVEFSSGEYNRVCIVCDSTCHHCHNLIFMYLCKFIGSRAPSLRGSR